MNHANGKDVDHDSYMLGYESGYAAVRNEAVEYIEKNAPEAADSYPLHDAQVVDTKILEAARTITRTTT